MLSGFTWLKTCAKGPAVVNTRMNLHFLHVTSRSTWIAEQLSEFLGWMFLVVSKLLRHEFAVFENIAVRP